VAGCGEGKIEDSAIEDRGVRVRRSGQVEFVAGCGEGQTEGQAVEERGVSQRETDSGP